MRSYYSHEILSWLSKHPNSTEREIRDALNLSGNTSYVSVQRLLKNNLIYISAVEPWGYSKKRTVRRFTVKS